MLLINRKKFLFFLTSLASFPFIILQSSKIGKSERPTPQARRPHSPVVKRKNEESTDDATETEDSKESDDAPTPPRASARDRRQLSEKLEPKVAPRPSKSLQKSKKDKRKEIESDSGRESADERM